MKSFSIFDRSDRQLLLIVFFIGLLGLNALVPSLMSAELEFLGDELTPLAQWIWHLCYNSFLLFFAVWYGLFMADQVDGNLLRIREAKSSGYWKEHSKPVMIAGVIFGTIALVIKKVFNFSFSWNEAIYQGTTGALFYQLFFLMVLLVLSKLLKIQSPWYSFVLVGLMMGIAPYLMQWDFQGWAYFFKGIAFFSPIGVYASYVTMKRGLIMAMFFQIIAFLIASIL
ncbi:MAG TPA: hypothetical protein VLA13_07490 [Massilibacterium sp.]|nr:hypothetical protein [Massilibacterium sp.]